MLYTCKATAIQETTAVIENKFSKATTRYIQYRRFIAQLRLRNHNCSCCLSAPQIVLPKRVDNSLRSNYSTVAAMLKKPVELRMEHPRLSASIIARHETTNPMWGSSASAAQHIIRVSGPNRDKIICGNSSKSVDRFKDNRERTLTASKPLYAGINGS